MNQFRYFKIVFLFIFSTCSLIAQTSTSELKTIWENTKNPDSIRFKALADFYIANNQAQPDATLKVLDYYYQLAKEKNNTKEIYNVANGRGGIYRLKGELDIAMRYYKEAQKLAIKLNDTDLKAANLGNIGNVYANKKDYKKALDHFSNSFKIYKKLNDKKGESWMLSSIGNVYLYIQNYDLALAYYQKALTAVKNCDVPPRSIAVIYLNIGWTNYELKKYKEAILHYEKALNILQVTNDKFFLVYCYSTLAKIYIELNELEKANFYAKKNSILCKELKIEGYSLDSEVIFAKIDFKKGNIKEARKKGETIIADLDKNSSHELKLSLYDLLYKCYQAENNLEKSLEMFQKYTIYKDSIQLEKNKISLIRDVIKNEFDDILQANKIKSEKEKAELASKQQQKTYVVIIGSIILIALIVFYFNRNLKKDRKKRDELIEEIEKLKKSTMTINSGVTDNFELNRINIENAINRKLNETDWNVLNVLSQNPVISNKEIASKIFMSVDGIGSSLRRMYDYFEIEESKYKKTDLIKKAIQWSYKA